MIRAMNKQSRPIRKSKEFWPKFGLASLAVVLALGDGVLNVLGGVAEGRKLTVGKAYSKVMESRGFREYYEELENLRKNNLKVILWRLKERGLVSKLDGKPELTKSGMKYYRDLKDGVASRDNWDGKWRIVMFDIPEMIRKERRWFKGRLLEEGYKPLQKSVLIGKMAIPEDLFREVERRRLRSYVNIMTVGEIDDETVFETFN